MSKEVLGHIDCPHCGLEKGMRITLDKSGAPFGYCEADCSGQMRVGGNAARVAKFYARHPHLKKPGAAPVEPAPAPAPEPAPALEKKAAPPAPKKTAKSATLTILESMAGGAA